MMPHFFAGEVKFPIRQSCGENTKIGRRTRHSQLDGEKAIYQDNSKLYIYQKSWDRTCTGNDNDDLGTDSTSTITHSNALQHVVQCAMLDVLDAVLDERNRSRRAQILH